MGGPRSLESCNPHNLSAARMPEISGLTDDLAKSAPSIELLQSLRDACRQQETALREEVARLETEVQNAHRGLEQRPYELYAIWVHQGVAGSGHYWAYLRDMANERWIRYDDAVVSVVSWDEVRENAFGQDGSNTSAYVLVYVDQSVTKEQRKSQDLGAVRQSAETVLPKELLSEIQWDNQAFREEQRQRQERLAELELRHHAEAIFQHYAGLIHQWEPLKRTGDSAGNPHDHVARKRLHDGALLKFELFLYRFYNEQEVWTHLLTLSYATQHKARQWKQEDEPRVLYLLAGILRSQKCYASMLRDVPGATRQCELVKLDQKGLEAKYKLVLTQAFLVDEALALLKDDHSMLVKAVGMLAFVWANWSLDTEDKFRQNEVLLVMSTLIYNTVNFLEKPKHPLSPPELSSFVEACDYFLILLCAVEWPQTWKSPLITRILTLFPQLSGSKRDTWPKDAILHHALTSKHDLSELPCPAPGQEFFERHRFLYSWVMQNDEAVAQEFVLSHAQGDPRTRPLHAS